MNWAKAMRNGIHMHLATQFPPGCIEQPERIFVSRPLLKILSTERPVCLSFDGEHVLFDGIVVKEYDAEEPEYYIAPQRGEFYEF